MICLFALSSLPIAVRSNVDMGPTQDHYQARVDGAAFEVKSSELCSDLKSVDYPGSTFSTYLNPGR